MTNLSTRSMKQPKFVITAEPVCFVKPYQPVSETISISRRGDKQHTTPLYIALSDDDIQISDAYIRELQAQEVERLTESLVRTLLLLDENYNAAIGIVKNEINQCNKLINELRHPESKRDFCDSCNDWPRGGCSSTCVAYDASKPRATHYHYHGDMPSDRRI